MNFLCSAKPAVAAISLCVLSATSADARVSHGENTPEYRSAELARVLAGERPERQAIEAMLAAAVGDGLSPAIRKAMVSRELRVLSVADDLAYIGTDFVGAWVMKTGQGLILIDALSSAEDVDAFLLPGLAQLGLRPADIRTLVITHGHFDHAGGAAVVLARYRPQLIMSEADWSLWNRSAAQRNGAPLPKPARFVADGDRVRLGTAQVELYLTPGHTPGTVSALIHAHDKGRPVVLSLWGGNALPRTLEPDERSGGLYAYRRSLLRFAELGRARGAVGMVSAHPLGDGSLEKARMVEANPTGANPWIVGEDYLMRFEAAYAAVADSAIMRLERKTP